MYDLTEMVHVLLRFALCTLQAASETARASVVAAHWDMTCLTLQENSMKRRLQKQAPAALVHSHCASEATVIAAQSNRGNTARLLVLLLLPLTLLTQCDCRCCCCSN